MIILLETSYQSLLMYSKFKIKYIYLILGSLHLQVHMYNFDKKKSVYVLALWYE